MDFNLREKAFRGNNKVCTVREDRKQEGEGKAVTEMEVDPRTIGEVASNCSKGRLRKGKTAGAVGG